LLGVTRVIHAVPESDEDRIGREESTVPRQIGIAPEVPGETPATPMRRVLLLASMPVRLDADDNGPKRLTRHERFPDEGHHQGR
jgi:hypothetical protein